MVFDPATLGLTAGINGIVGTLTKVAIEALAKRCEGKSQELLDELPLQLERTAHQYAEKYYNRHGLVKALGMDKPMSLDDLYIAVNVLSNDLAKCFASLQDQEKLYKTQRSQSFHAKPEAKQPGIDAANAYQYLMVLGGPGIGKSTFLRRMGLEALKGSTGAYRHQGLIPVLLELRNFRSGSIDLKGAIAQEFANCGLSDYEDCTEKLLKDGQLLILLDGLDEVATERTAEMVQKIQDLVDSYDGNRFIASCRIAAYRYSFRRFTDITVADFDDGQIEGFIQNWFRSHQQEDWGRVCWKKLRSNDYRSTKELAHTPLLLVLICIIHKKTGQFPANKATLYQKALDTLLEEWDASKEIVREVLYPGFDTRRRTLLLAEVAYASFTENKLFFQGQEIAKLIESILPEMLTGERLFDGKKVIRAIESQHGLLVARDEGVYSFSHLTIQEYLTALHIVERNLNDGLVSNYLFDRNWREVFILAAGICQPDQLLLAMESKVHSCMNTKKLQDLLAWVARVANSKGVSIKPLGKRALAIANACANAYTRHDDGIIVISPKTIANANAIGIANANVSISTINDPSPIVIGTINTNTIESFLNYARAAQANEIYQGIDILDLIAALEILQSEVPSKNQPTKVWYKFGSTIIQTWLKAFHLSLETLEFDDNELKAIDDYLYAIKLLIDCRQAAARVDLQAWAVIESRLLMPYSAVGDQPQSND